MATQNKGESETAYLLKYLLAIELYRSGLSQTEIRKRVGLSMNVVNDMLKGLTRHVELRADNGD